MESFGNRLAEFRRQRNLTQNDIADRLNISAQAVSKWENDLTSPDIDTLIKLSDIFEVSLDELLGKQKNEVVFVPEERRKSIDEMMFRIVVNSAEGDRIRINLPMAAMRILVNNDTAGMMFNGNETLKSIDFNQIYAMAEQGLMGELVSVDSAEGDHVIISVE